MELANKATIKKVAWNDIRHDFMHANRELAIIIDKLDPNSKYPLFEAVYPYGAAMIERGCLYLPSSSGTLVSLESPEMDKELKQQLSYNIGTNPVSIVLCNNFEITMTINSHTIPLYGLIPPGKIFSTSRILSTYTPHSPAFLWKMTAGARSIFMLPKISDARANYRLKQLFHLNFDPPQSLLDHWAIFKELANSEAFGEKWTAKILYFGKKWFEHLHDPAWMEFRNYLLQSAWDSSEFWRNQFVWDLIFSIIQKNKNLRPNPYIMDTVKHLYTMAVSAVPGFSPTFNDNAAPIKRLQQIYLDDYRLNYAPIIMQPDFLSTKNPVYYSLSYPCTIEFSPSSQTEMIKIVALRDIIYLFEKCKNEILSGSLNIHDTPLYEAIKKVSFDFFHVEEDKKNNIKSSSEIPLLDPFFKLKNKPFPNNCHFVNGCIRLTTKG